MAEFDAPQSEASLTRIPPPARLPADDEAFGEMTSKDVPAARSGREGLPASYRMRADRHYIDHMTSESVGLPVRLIPVEYIEATTAAPVESLTKSIATHGVLQPLLVRKNGARYRLIAGRSRLASAIAAGLRAVPCLLHDVGERQAAALSDAENVRHAAVEAVRVPAAPVSIVNIADVLSGLTADLVRLDRSTALLRSSGASFYQKTAVDLVAAQSWRLNWSVKAAAFLAADRRPPVRMQPLMTVVHHVLEGCSPELRLSRARMGTDVSAVASVMIDEASGELALTGAILATLSLLETAEQPALDVRGEWGAGLLALHITQSAVAAPAEWSRSFSDPCPDMKGNLVVHLAAATLRAFSAPSGGSLDLLTTPDGTCIRCVVGI